MSYTDPSGRPGLGASLGGCLLAALFALVMLFPLLFGSVWGGAHCAPVPDCQRRIEWGFAGQAAIVLTMAAVLGLSVRALLYWIGRRNLEGAEAGGPPAWALLGLPAALLAGYGFITRL